MQRGGVARSVRHAHRPTEHLASWTFALVVESGQRQKLTDLAPFLSSDIYRGEIVSAAAAGESSAQLRFKAVAK
jgi:hypothetical protein